MRSRITEIQKRVRKIRKEHEKNGTHVFNAMKTMSFSDSTSQMHIGCYCGVSAWVEAKEVMD